MTRNLTRLVIVAAVLVLCAQLAIAQNANVQITSGPTVQNVSGDSATIAWSTNVPSSSVVKYGTDPNNLSQKEQEAWGGTNHSVTLKGLKSGQTYFYYVTSGEASGTGTSVSSKVGKFVAGQNAPAQAASSPTDTGRGSTNENMVQTVAGPIAQQITSNSAVIWWETNTPSSSIVRYGTDRNYSQTAQKPWGMQNHKVELTNLQPDTLYYVYIASANGNNLGETGFRTLPANAGTQQFSITDGPYVSKLGDRSATITWTTSAASSSVVKYGTALTQLTQTAEAPWGQTNHSVTISNLNPNTKYYFSVQSGQARGTGMMAQSPTGMFRTVPPGQQAFVLANER